MSSRVIRLGFLPDFPISGLVVPSYIEAEPSEQEVCEFAERESEREAQEDTCSDFEIEIMQNVLMDPLPGKERGKQDEATVFIGTAGVAPGFRNMEEDAIELDMGTVVAWRVDFVAITPAKEIESQREPVLHSKALMSDRTRLYISHSQGEPSLQLPAVEEVIDREERAEDRVRCSWLHLGCRFPALLEAILRHPLTKPVRQL